MLDRSLPPRPIPAPDLSLPTPHTHLVQPDFPLFVVEDTTQEVVQLSCILQHNTLSTRLDHALPHFVARLLTEGTETHDKTYIANHIDHYGASLYATATKDTLELHLLTLAQHFHHLLPLFMEVLTQPAFPQAALALEQKVAIQDIDLRDATPSSLARKWLRQQVFGPHHPYGYSLESQDVADITPEALHRSFRHHITQQGCCVLAGNVDPSLVQATQKALADLPPRAPAHPRYTPTPSLEPLHLPKEGAVQTSVVLGAATIPRTHPDYPRWYVLNALLGGYFGARLMQNIREDKGYTYGIHSQLTPYLHDTFFSIMTDVKQGLADETCQEVDHEITRLHTTLVSTEELGALKSFLRGRLLAQFDNVFACAKRLGKAYIHGVDLGHYRDLYATVQSIQPATLQETAQKYLSFPDLAQVIVNP